jgi:hypothetical protein
MVVRKVETAVLKGATSRPNESMIRHRLGAAALALAQAATKAKTQTPAARLEKRVSLKINSLAIGTIETVRIASSRCQKRDSEQDKV